MPPAMRRDLRTMLAAFTAAAIAGCASAPPPHATTEPALAAEAPPAAPARRPLAIRPQLGYALPGGRHDCELGRSVSLRRDPHDASRIDLEWQGERYAMVRHSSSSGLPRYEHPASRLVWIELPWKGMLLDGRTGRPLANECRPA